MASITKCNWTDALYKLLSQPNHHYVRKTIVQYYSYYIIFMHFTSSPEHWWEKLLPATVERIQVMLAIGLILAAVCVTLSIYSTSGQICNSYLHIVNHNYNYCGDLLLACSTTNALRLYNPNGNTITEGGMLQICLSGIWRAACDFSFGCTTNGRAACRQLGYGGSQISECMTNLYLTLKICSSHNKTKQYSCC